ncbi:MAG TPA: hypothetical protein VGA60_07510 [Kiloniellales bacterium]|jgi:hypothetical protein
MVRPVLAALAAGILLAACGQLPRPFQPEDKSGNALLNLRDGAGIVVQPIAGAPTAGGQILAEALVARLRDRDIPAGTENGNLGSRHLMGRAAVRPLPGGREEILLYWEMREPDGGRTGILTQRREQAAGAWAAGAPALLETLAEALAPEVAALVQDPALASSPRVKAAAIPGFPGARLVVLQIPGAPGDAAHSLPSALEAALQAAKLPVADRIGDNDLLILGDVAVGPKDGDLQTVAIRWSLVSARDDRELGEIAQQNVVPAGSLDGPWGPVADEVARAAASGLLDLLGQAGKL